MPDTKNIYHIDIEKGKLERADHVIERGIEEVLRKPKKLANIINNPRITLKEIWENLPKEFFEEFTNTKGAKVVEGQKAIIETVADKLEKAKNRKEYSDEDKELLEKIHSFFKKQAKEAEEANVLMDNKVFEIQLSTTRVERNKVEDLLAKMKGSGLENDPEIAKIQKKLEEFDAIKAETKEITQDKYIQELIIKRDETIEFIKKLEIIQKEKKLIGDETAERKIKEIKNEIEEIEKKKKDEISEISSTEKTNAKINEISRFYNEKIEEMKGEIKKIKEINIHFDDRYREIFDELKENENLKNVKEIKEIKDGNNLIATLDKLKLDKLKTEFNKKIDEARSKEEQRQYTNIQDYSSAVKFQEIFKEDAKVLEIKLGKLSETEKEQKTFGESTLKGINEIESHSKSYLLKTRAEIYENVYKDQLSKGKHLKNSKEQTEFKEFTKESSALFGDIRRFAQKFNITPKYSTNIFAQEKECQRLIDAISQAQGLSEADKIILEEFRKRLEASRANPIHPQKILDQLIAKRKELEDIRTQLSAGDLSGEQLKELTEKRIWALRDLKKMENKFNLSEIENTVKSEFTKQKKPTEQTKFINEIEKELEIKRNQYNVLIRIKKYARTIDPSEIKIIDSKLQLLDAEISRLNIILGQIKENKKYYETTQRINFAPDQTQIAEQLQNEFEAHFGKYDKLWPWQKHRIENQLNQKAKYITARNALIQDIKDSESGLIGRFNNWKKFRDIHALQRTIDQIDQRLEKLENKYKKADEKRLSRESESTREFLLTRASENRKNAEEALKTILAPEVQGRSREDILKEKKEYEENNIKKQYDEVWKNQLEPLGVSKDWYNFEWFKENKAMWNNLKHHVYPSSLWNRIDLFFKFLKEKSTEDHGRYELFFQKNFKDEMPKFLEGQFFNKEQLEHRFAKWKKTKPANDEVEKFIESDKFKVA